MASREQGPRWWPALLILVLLAGALVWIWAPADSPVPASQPTATLFLSIIGGMLLLIWWLLLSRTRWSTRLGVVLALGALWAVVRTFVDVHTTGDIVPRFSLKRAAPTPAPLPPATARPAPPATAADAPREDEPANAMADTAEDEAAADVAETETEAASEAIGAPPEESEVALAETVRPAPAFPQFLGPGRDATIEGVRLVPTWDATPPVVLWRQPIGAGWSGFAVTGDLAVTQEQRDGREYVVAYDVATGRARWSHEGGEGFSSPMAGDGPRATPTISSGRVYTMGVHGSLRAFELESGRLLFERDVLAENDAGSPQWGVAASPLVVDDDVVVVAAGGSGGRSLVAYDALTGERRWSGGDDPAAYSSPRLATIDGVRQILVFNRAHLTGHDVATGEVLWQDAPLSDRPEKIAQPVVFEDGRIFVSQGYGVGSRMIRVARGPEGGFRVETLWDSPRLKAKFTQVVHHDGFLYGLDEGVLVCLDPATGERRWKKGRYGHGQVLLVGESLLVQGEDGELVLIDPDPEALVELARFQAVDGRVWATPSLVGDLLLVRSETEAACYRLTVEALAGAAASASGGAHLEREAG